MDEATPRPWMPQSRDDGKADPWWIDTHAYPDGPQPVWAPPQYPVSEADVTLICAAVNAYDRLRAIEAAAGLVTAAYAMSQRKRYAALDTAIPALRAALEVPSDAR